MDFQTASFSATALFSLKCFLSGHGEEFSAFVGSWEANAFDAMRFLQNILLELHGWKFSQYATLTHESNQVHSSMATRSGYQENVIRCALISI
ncbi:uncharacterized protein Bfra_006121 [Botrytis fragariae]|uniref:Uncharacterized protein n=1 Tax=Botrytis fragariae TaxID=1964551 RepID=A0A8H6ASH4_9HELO|nr:uncharacterized protein Bfra_006121 [Botrytis fragariae]KAF5872758.1 hypothetical protein Bfra_006121 [Botrytis fragariae]